ncbi:MAG: P-type conjugative transfer protein TrbJ [Acidithiobacillus sp.]|jgi:P-type conjugative transfer protein TrbJ
MRIRFSVLALTVLTATASAPALAGGGIGINPLQATLPEQLTQEITSVAKLAKQAQSVEEEIQSVENQVQNMVSLPMNLYQSLVSPIGKLISVVNQAQGLSYAAQNIPAEFQAEYGQGVSALMPNGYSASLAQWSQDEQNQVQNVLQDYHMTESNFASTQATLQQLESAGQSASGRKAVLDAANQIAGLQVEQIQSLQSTIMQGDSAMLKYIQNRNIETNQKQQSIKGWLNGAGNDADQDLM